jgi:protein-L-isoaspartate(D-aspartate) O-methyltransferase
VTTLEIRPELAAMARANLDRAGLKRVQVLQADGAGGLPKAAPFDVIVLSGSVAAVPEILFDQLQPGGRLVAVVGQLPIMTAVLYTRTASGMQAVDLFDTVAPRLAGFDEPSRFAF